jgi:hypothetical protein
VLTHFRGRLLELVGMHASLTIDKNPSGTNKVGGGGGGNPAQSGPNGDRKKR